MHVCIIAGSHPPLICGIGDYTAPLALALCRAGLKVTLLVSPSCIPDDVAGLPYRLVQIESWSLRHLSKICAAVKGCKPDIAHIIYPAKAYGYALSPIVLPYILGVSGLRTVLTLHEFKMAHPLRKLADIVLMIPTSGVLVPSSSERESIARYAPSVARKVRVSTAGPTIRPCWLQEDMRGKMRRELGIEGDEFVVAYFGFIHPNKGTEVALKAFWRFNMRCPKSRLMVIGEFKPKEFAYHRAILELAERLRINGRILWMGAQQPQNVSHLLQLCDAALLPFPDGASTRRGTLIVCIQHGLPTVTVRGEVEVERRFGDAILFVDSPSDYDGMAEMLCLLHNGLKEEMSKRAMSLIPSWEGAWDEIASHTVSLYLDALSKRA
ncbi:MAG: hypothetical protein HZRFUVUK_001701 [Candidatus Fervidibacterota bacterium]|jgi:glycosyltransferase involved in cell wall biosynthesis